MQQDRDPKRRKIVGSEQLQEEKQTDATGALNTSLPLANWHRRGTLLEDCLVGDGVLLRELVGIVDGYCGKRFEGRSTELTGHTNTVRSVCAMGDGRLASGSLDTTIRIWDLGEEKGGECVQTLTGHTSSVTSLCVLSNGRLASAGSYDRTIRIWDLSEEKGGECVQTLTGHTSSVRSVCAMGDGRLASGSDDNTIRIWDLNKGGECVQTLTGHTNNVRSVCAMGDGRLASGSYDRTIRIWDLREEKGGECVQTLTGHAHFVFGIELC